MSYYPLNLNISGKICLVVGGGQVAWRKIRSLLGCGGKVTVISPEVVPEIALLAGRNELLWEKRGYKKGDIAGALLVFAATDNQQVQAEVAAEAEEQGILLNIADSPTRCDFHVPAKVRRGELLLTISTGGGSPAISKMVRQQLEEQFGLEYGEVIYLFATIREKLLAVSNDSEANKKMFHQLLASNIFDCVRDRQWLEVGEILATIFPLALDTDDVLRRLIDFIGNESATNKEEL